MASRLRSLLRTPILQNSGSTARDHLASERTYLSWLRTGLGFVALGVAVERFSQFELELGTTPVLPHQRYAAEAATSTGGGQEAATARVKRTQEHVEREQVLVASLLGTGVGCIAYGAARYFSTLRLLQQGLFKPAYGGAGALGLSVAALAGCAWWGMVREEREMHEDERERKRRSEDTAGKR